MENIRDWLYHGNCGGTSHSGLVCQQCVEIIVSKEDPLHASLCIQ
jgi:hypothetical protein